MANLIPQHFIDEVLTRVDIVSVIEPFVPMRKVGSNFVGLCPFHQEKTGSFTVSPQKQIYHCFGCGVSGNAIGFLMNYERLSFVDSIEALASQVGLELPEETVEKVQHSESESLYSVLEKSAKFYQMQLHQSNQSNKALDYFQKRGLSDEIIRQFGLGYAPKGWDNLLLAIGQESKQRELLFKSGMLIKKPEKGTYYDRFRERVMFPIRDRRGRVIAFGGRVLTDEQPKYLNSPETPVFHKGNELYGLHEARQSHARLNQLLLVEGYMDVIALVQHGIDYAVATLGTAMTRDHAIRLFRITPEVVFCFDGDDAGRTAAWRALEITMPILRDEWSAKFMFLPEKEDPDSIIRLEGKEKFEERIADAKSLSDFFFEHLSESVNLKHMEGRARLVSLAMPHIQKMSAEAMQSMLLDELANIAGVPVDKLDSYGKKKEEEMRKKPQLATNLTVAVTPVRLAITLLIQQPHLAQYLNDEFSETDMPGINLINELNNLMRSNLSLTTANLLEYWRDKPEFDFLVKFASYDYLPEASDIESEFKDTIMKVRQHITEYEVEKLMSKASQNGLTDEERKQLQALLRIKTKLGTIAKNQGCI